MSEIQVATVEVTANPSHSTPAALSAVPGPSPFQSKLSAHNAGRNVASGSPKRGQPPASTDVPFVSRTFTNSSRADAVTAQCEKLDLSADSAGPNSLKSKGNNAKKRGSRKANNQLRLQMPESEPQQSNVDVSENIIAIQQLFKKQIAPLYATSSAQYLENMASHPHFQYMHGVHPHTAPARQPPLPSPTFVPHTYTPPVAQEYFQSYQTSYSAQTINLPKQPHASTMNGIQQSPQYLKNLMQHPLLCNYVQMETGGKEKHKRSRRKKSSCLKTPTDKHLFEDYLLLEEVEKGLKDNVFFEGVMRINPKQYIHAYITTSRDEQDIFIDGLRNRNRALEGDIVVVELIENIDKDSTIDSVNCEESRDDIEEGKKESDNVERDCEGKEEKTNRRGRVVYIKEKVHPRTTIGYLKLMPDKNRQRALFVPRDHRVPRLNIPCTSWPDNFYKEAKEYENILFLVRIDDWKDTRFALGTVVCNIGQVGDIKTETRALLAENDLDVTPFGPEVKKFFPGPDFTIPVEEIALREDCRKLCIFSIDPYNCRDVDDAVSCRFLDNGNYEIGVHISDVGYFLKENTILDEKVADKATTVYLVERAYHMLPEELCMLCSLFSGIDKLAFSVFWEISNEGKVLGHRFAKTVIHSCAQLAYEHAQAILDGHKPEDLPPICNGFKYDDICRTVETLGKIAQIFRINRYNNGALKINQPKVSFRLDQTNGLPISFAINDSQESHQLIEEFMLLANMTVAERIHKDHPRLAFLRCHPPPSKFMLEDLAKQMKSMDIELDISSAGDLYRSLLPHIGPECVNKQKAMVLSMLCTKPMTRAKYFCADGWNDEDFSHYALNVPLYTHFTSPIRRYADVMVHRLLAASIECTKMPEWEVDRVRWIAANCNKQKYNAKKAGEMSTELYTLKYIEMHSPVLTAAVVVDVKEKFFDVIVMALGFNRRIYVNNIAPATCKHIKNSAGSRLSKLQITWPKTDEFLEIVQVIELFSVIQVQMVKGDDMVKVDTQVVRPSHENPVEVNN